VPATGYTGVRELAARQTEYLSPAAEEVHFALVGVPPVDFHPAQYRLLTAAHHLVPLLQWPFELMTLKSSDLFRELMG